MCCFYPKGSGLGEPVKPVYKFFTMDHHRSRGEVVKKRVGEDGGSWHCWTSCCLDHVRTNGCVWCGCLEHEGPPGTVLLPFFFTLYTSDFNNNSVLCHLQMFSDDYAIVSCISDGDEQVYRRVILDFMDWCEQNTLLLNKNKTKKLVVDFWRNNSNANSREHPGLGY